MQMSLWKWKQPSDGVKMIKTLSDIGIRLFIVLSTISSFFILGFGRLKSKVLIYVNGRDEHCDEKFVWCGDKNYPNNTVGPEFPWSESEPNDFGGNENCVALNTNGVDGTLIDVQCYTKAYFVCQASACMLSYEIKRFDS